MRKHVTALFAAAVLCAPPLLAQQAAPPQGIPKPPAELSQLSIFLGNWTCTGTGFASPMAPEHPTSATVKGSTAAGGRWIHLVYDEKGANAVHAAMYMGYDAGRKQFVLGCVDNLGTYCTQASTGWSGDTLTFEGKGHMDGQEMAVRDTFTRKGTAQLTHQGEFQGKDGPVGEDGPGDLPQGREVAAR